MKVVQSLLDVCSEKSSRQIGLTIGNFDGLHQGHRFFLQSLKEKCIQNNLLFVVMTFVPHPRQILFPDQKNYLINTYEDRRNLFDSFGVDYLVEVGFTRDLSMLSPIDFMNEHIFKQKNLACLYVGHDFAFGENKSGDHQFIEKICKDKKVTFAIQKEFKIDGDIVSSTLIRDTINGGNVVKAIDLLGRKYFIKGVVIKGAGRGKQIGFPTANIKFDRELIFPGGGTYITRTICNKMTYDSLTNVGYNPTFGKNQPVSIETFIFDFDKFIYGEELQVQFLERIRSEVKFDSANALIDQIRSDVKLARDFFIDLNNVGDEC